MVAALLLVRFFDEMASFVPTGTLGYAASMLTLAVADSFVVLLAWWGIHLSRARHPYRLGHAGGPHSG